MANLHWCITNLEVSCALFVDFHKFLRAPTFIYISPQPAAPLVICIALTLVSALTLTLVLQFWLWLWLQLVCISSMCDCLCRPIASASHCCHCLCSRYAYMCSWRSHSVGVEDAVAVGHSIHLTARIFYVLACVSQPNLLSLNAASLGAMTATSTTSWEWRE